MIMFEEEEEEGTPNGMQMVIPSQSEGCGVEFMDDTTYSGCNQSRR